MQKIINYLDNHRLILVILILLVISIIFFSYKSYSFLHHEFKSLDCEDKIDDIYCKNNGLIILIEPEEEKNKIFKDYKKEIEKLKKDYNLKDFSFYTVYQYKVASEFNYYNGGKEELYNFFTYYINTYNIEEFYHKNEFYFEIFYNYKLPSITSTKKEENRNTFNKIYK